MLVWQLVNDDLFTQKEADYAAEQVHFDWKENAVKEADLMQTDNKFRKICKYLLKIENL